MGRLPIRLLLAVALMLTAAAHSLAGAERPLSPRAAGLKETVDACGAASDPNCQPFKDVMLFCMDRKNWPSDECVALREFHAYRHGKWQLERDARSEPLRKRCEEDQTDAACEQWACSDAL